MAWTFRTMIVADAVVDTCRSLAMLLAGEEKNSRRLNKTLIIERTLCH